MRETADEEANDQEAPADEEDAETSGKPKAKKGKVEEVETERSLACSSLGRAARNAGLIWGRNWPGKFTSPHATGAQQNASRQMLLSAYSPASQQTSAFRKGMRKLGMVAGQEHCGLGPHHRWKKTLARISGQK